MTNKEKIQVCVTWFKMATENVEYALANDDWDEASHIIENWIIKDANEALQLLKKGLKDGKTNN